MSSNTKSYIWFVTLYVTGVVGVGLIHYAFKYFANGLVFAARLIV
ncbi:MAG: hypothetical protein VX835_03235 [Pseudomonadota bacterium]|nr:hypothetical protein [Pseudomonadota bacterium]